MGTSKEDFAKYAEDLKEKLVDSAKAGLAPQYTRVVAAAIRASFDMVLFPELREWEANEHRLMEELKNLKQSRPAAW